MADGRYIEKYWKYHNSPSNEPIGTKLGWWYPMTFPTCLPWWGCHGNGRCLATAHWTFRWASGGRTHEPILMKFGIGLQQKIRTTMTVTWSNIKIFKIQNGGWHWV